MRTVRSVQTRTIILSRLRNATAICLTVAFLVLLTGCNTISHETSEAEEIECLSVLGVGICLEYNQPVVKPTP